MNGIGHIRLRALWVTVLLIAGVPGVLMAQHTSRASQTVTFAVVPVHTPAAAQGAARVTPEKVTIGPVSSSATTLGSSRPAAADSLRPRAIEDSSAKPRGPSVITITE